MAADDNAGSVRPGSPVESESEIMPVAVKGLGHIVLYVADLTRSTQFYRDVLGWPLLHMHGAAAAVFRAADIHHDLLLLEVGPHAAPLPAGPRLGLYHFGVKMGDSDDDLRAVRSRLMSRPDLGKVHGAVDGGFIHSLYTEDPDGNEVELYIDVPGWDWSAPDAAERAGRAPLVL
ncbi:MAG: VOC family protein [Rhodococcus sp. (in: high G+C Gram-positive bacteria)]|uniref:VOC family protein n=1 Tax=Rhodococcus sp. TaxID=1831 RepID=UPI002AD96C65|nr:VOC family protein [Rhodococcus sp. (in: high G+C Gram-positive bacteria)]